MDWRIRFLSSLFQDGGRHWQHRNQIRSHSAVRGKIILGEGGERPSLSLLIASKDLLSGGRQRGGSVLIFRVVAQATCVKLYSTIAFSIQHQRSISARYLSPIPPSRLGTPASLPRVGLVSNGQPGSPSFLLPQRVKEGGRERETTQQENHLFSRRNRG